MLVDRHRTVLYPRHGFVEYSLSPPRSSSRSRTCCSNGSNDVATGAREYDGATQEVCGTRFLALLLGGARMIRHFVLRAISW